MVNVQFSLSKRSTGLDRKVWVKSAFKLLNNYRIFNDTAVILLLIWTGGPNFTEQG